MKKLLPAVFLSLCFLANAQVSVKNLLTENLSNPIGLGVSEPRFSWQLHSDKQNVMQTAYEIKVYSAGKEVWNSGKVQSDSSIHVVYKGTELSSDTKYQWQVRVWDNRNKGSKWSKVNSFHTAFYKPEDWQAKWIGPGYTEDSVMRPSPYFRKEFSTSKKISSATLFATAHGMYELQINGKRVGDAYLTPGWTTYQKRLQYQVYDVTSQIISGTNAIGAILGSGWYRGTIGFTDVRNYFGKDIALLLQLNIKYTDGTTETIITDNSWKSATGAITYSEIYNGEIQDRRLEKSAFSTAGFNDNDWHGVSTPDNSFDHLVATYNEPVKKHETFKPVKIFTTPKGEKVIDFGQNLVGWVIMRTSGNAGDSIKLSHAEVLDKQGNFYTENLRSAKCENIYVLSGKGREEFEPHFTWQGFRYVKVDGYNGDLNAADFEAVALYSAMATTGKFTTSNKLINQLQHNIEWGQKGNFLDVPTDCPQRDERLGWTGDAQAFSRTATFNMNVNNFFAKWLKDLEAEQVNGSVPFVVPNVLGNTPSSCGWADAATIVPWNLYLAYGDKRLLAHQYNSMKSYVESIRRDAKNNLWNTGFHFGDWLFYRPDDDNDGRAAVTDKYLIAQCFYAHSTHLLVNAAKVLGFEQDAVVYSSLLKDIKEAFNKEYVTPSGRLISGTQTAYVLALNFDMLPENLQQQAAKRLAENINSYGNHLTTGFLGTPYLCHVLSRFGYNDLAFKLLLQPEYPGWLYPVRMGATTIWERWDGQKPDGSFQTAGMNSFNHYAYGAIGDWMYRKVAGLDTDSQAVGYKVVTVKPTIGGRFKKISAMLETYYGTTSSEWEVVNNKFKLKVIVPPNSSASIYIPTNNKEMVFGGKKRLVEDATLPVIEGYFATRVGSGTYTFEAQRPENAMDSLDINQFIGKFESKGEKQLNVNVINDNGWLTVKALNNEYAVDPVWGKKDRFETISGENIEFERNNEGKIIKAKFAAHGRSYELYPSKEVTN